ncbi:amino acid adenylation domain-containing protein [Trichocoleus sp. DQ-U1]|uniref:amino acid adenylation domain-containing protein n=1 Tax=Trichocoleus sp. DQ-U1 TaxID=2933926 RepID=UPI0032968268
MIKHFNNSKISVANSEQQFDGKQTSTEAERHKFLVEWNHTTKEYPQDKCIHQLFEEQVELTPNAVVVLFEGEQLTYRELNARANQLAHYLKTLGVGPEVLVGICVERSIEMIVGLLGILKAGGAYLPLDAEYPQERLQFMLQDAQVSVLLTQERLINKLPEHQAKLVYVDTDWHLIAKSRQDNPITDTQTTNLAYVIYTSGSTGKPKGVTVPHRAVTRLVLNTNYINLQPLDVVAFASNVSFDAATFEIWGTLLNGASLAVITKDVALSPCDFAAQIHELGITVLFLTTALFNLLVREVPSALQSVQHLLFGGEAPDPKWVKQLLKKGSPQRVVHVYGPTENTTFTTWYLVQDVPEEATTIPIGRPIANTQVYILDEYLQPVPVGATGELHIGGAGLARGYLNCPELTNEKFIPNPFDNSKLYKTGDLARYLPNGNIEYLGRIDNQVKIRGFRIELGEIEAVLRQHPAVLGTVVVMRQDVSDRKYLVAYIVPKESTAITRSDLRGFLKEKLPNYMIPGVFVMLDALPLTSNGKVDRRALPEDAEKMALKESEIELSNLNIDIPTYTKQGDTVLENTRLESISSTLRSLMAKLLQIDINEIDASATFLDLGTDSLLLLEAVRSIQSHFGVQVKVQQFFEELETIDALATYIEQNMSFEPEQKNYQENELYPIRVTPANLESSKTSPKLAQTKVLNVPIAVPEDRAMNRLNENVEPETSVERIISQQLQLMSQQLELLRNERPRKERSHDEKTTVTEFASPKSFHQSATVTHSSPVCSYNEWDPLEEVIVGIVDGAMVPSWHTIHRATVLPGQEKQMESLAKRTQKQPLPYPEWLVQAASKCVEEFAHILESEGVIVRRPDIVDYSASFRTPDWEVMNGFCSANPRDVFLVIGNEIIEAPMADRTRYFESWAYRSLLKEYLKGGAKWVAAPKPQLLDAQYDPDYKAPAPGEERRFVITEFEPTFDAADFVRFGRDIFVQKSHVTNSFGIEWVRRHLGDEYRVHEVQSLCPQALHIDTTLVPLAPGKVLVNPLFIDVDSLPDYFKSWDILLAPKPNRTPMALYDTKVISQWVNMNVLSLDEERVIVEKSQEYMIQALKDWGFKPIPCEFESYYPFMGSFHCATLDVRRRGVLRSYEMEEGAL